MARVTLLLGLAMRLKVQEIGEICGESVEINFEFFLVPFPTPPPELSQGT